MLEFKSSIDSFEDLRRQTLCCDFVLDAIEKAEKEDDFMSHLEDMFFMNNSEIPTMTELNDYIRFEYETIFECLGLDENGEEIIEDEYNHMTKRKCKIKNTILKITFGIIFCIFILACLGLDDNIYLCGSIASISLIVLTVFYHINYDYFMKEV